MLACAIIAQLMLMPLPNAGEAIIQQGWIDPIVGQSGKRPDDTLVAFAYGHAIAKALPHDRQAEPMADCTADLRGMGVKIGPWVPDGERPDDSPDGHPAIHFTNVTQSSNHRLALVAWNYYYGPLNAGSHHAVLRRERGHWRLVGDRRYGPIS